jgi:peptidoglycan/xylan/chitin deacetylase (PgdA/CDA1 family)
MLQLSLACLFLTVAFSQQPVNVYLTFDDGPGPGSRQLYSLADSGNVKINLFVVGHRVLRGDSSSVIFRQHHHDSLILICNHSFSHAGRHYRQYYEDAAAVLRDFDQNRDTLALENNITRLPGRNCWRVGGRAQDDIVNGKEAADSLAAHGYKVFGWDVEWKADSLHWRTGTEMMDKVEKTVQQLRTFTPRHIVILFHDEEFQDAIFREEVRSFVNLLGRKAGYRIAHLTEYPSGFSHIIR